MDYPYYNPTTTAQPFQYLQLPPTPTHTHRGNSTDEYSNESPPESYDHSFPNFETFRGFDSNGIVTDSPQPQKPKVLELNGDGSKYMDPDGNDLQRRQSARSSSDEKESLTPAQSRRKAQNRAAQRAFRERKERHVKDLEQKLSSLEQSSTDLLSENDRLKRELQKIATENEILRATGGAAPNGHGADGGPVLGPMHYSPTDFYTDLLQSHDNKTPSHRVTVSDRGERLLGAGATWDLIMNDPLYKEGLVDVGAVSETLKPKARCDGQGPVFEEADIKAAIRASAASGSDELI
jgi:hypothetical protein